jgi:hypothetical protein
LGIVFSLDLNYKRDVFFENIGTIDDWGIQKLKTMIIDKVISEPVIYFV